MKTKIQTEREVSHNAYQPKGTYLIPKIKVYEPNVSPAINNTESLPLKQG
jgi:hypothetical protein